MNSRNRERTNTVTGKQKGEPYAYCTICDRKFHLYDLVENDGKIKVCKYCQDDESYSKNQQQQ